MRFGTHAGLLLTFAALGSCSGGGSGGGSGAPAGSGTPVYVSDERGNQVLVIDSATGTTTRTIKAGARPRGIHLSPDGKTLYVAVSGSPIGGPGVDESKLPPADHTKDGIAVVDTSDGTVRRVLHAGSDPETFTLTPDGKTLLVSNENASLVSIVDSRGLRAARSIKVGDEPEGVAITRDGKLLYVACEGSDAVMVFDMGNLKQVASVPLAGRPRTLLASSDGRVIYVAVETGGKLAVIEAATGRLIRTVDLARGDARVRPMGLAEAPGGNSLFVSTGRAGTVIEVDASAGTAKRTITDVGARPWGIALMAGGRMLVTANGPSGDISLIDRASGKVRARFKAGVGPWGVDTPR